MTEALNSAHLTRAVRIVVLFFTAMLAAFAMLGATTGTAHADEVGSEYNYKLKGNVTFQEEPVEGALIQASGPGGFTSEVKTDAEGRWQIGVPEKGSYKVTLVESSLPEGVIVEGGQATVDAEFGLTKNKTVSFFLGKGERVTTSLFDQVLQRMFTGLNFGLLLALAALGVSLIFGTTGLSNFAHAEMITIGALMTYTFGVTMQLPIVIAFALALLVSAFFGYGMDVTIWRPLRKRGVGVVQLMIVSIGLSMAVRYVFQFFYGGETVHVPGATSPATFTLGPIQASWIDVASMGVSIVMIVLTGLFLLKTRIGKATRAVSDNPSLAAASGIDVDGVIRIVWVLSAFLAGMAGILWAYYRPGVAWDMGFQILLLVFAAVTLGGLGTAWGALIGSLIIGMFTELSTLVLPSDMKYVGALVALILVLLLRPQGILGRKERIG